MHAGRLSVSFAIGALIIERLYDGDVEAYRSRGRKDASLRDLGDMVGTTATFLSRSVTVYLQERELPGDLRGSVSVSHHKQLARLPSQEERGQFVRDAVDEGWSAGALKRQITKHLKKTGRKPGPADRSSKGGRPAAGSVQRTLTLMEKARDGLLDGNSVLGRLQPLEGLRLLGKLRRAVNGVLARIAEIEVDLREQCQNVATLAGPTLVSASGPKRGPLFLVPAPDPRLRAPPPPDPGVP